MRRSLAGSNFWIFRMAMGLLLMAAISAADRPTLFEEANRLYEQGKYSDAISHYENIIQGGRKSAAIFFNLGNAYFKQGNLGSALLNYRKGEAIAPRDPDIQANLRFTRDRVSNSVSVQPGRGRRALNYFTLNELTRIAGLLFWVWAALYCAIHVRPALRSSLRTPQLLAGAAFALVICLFALIAASREPIAIVTSKQATVHLGPLPESQPAFTATDGTELRLIEARPDWLHVADRTGRTGWLPSTHASVFHGS